MYIFKIKSYKEINDYTNAIKISRFCGFLCDFKYIYTDFWIKLIRILYSWIYPWIKC